MTATASQIESRPNFLVFVVDQLRASHVGFGGNAVVRTPNLDALAAEAVVFDRAYVSNPLCMPNRATLATGMVPSAHGTRFNGMPLDWDITTVARTLREAGWTTVAVGKLHHQNMLGNDGDVEGLLAGESGELAVGEGVRRRWPAGWETWESMERHRRGLVRMPDDYYGYERVDLVVGHSDYATGHYYQWAREHGVELDDLRGDARSPHRYTGWRQVYQSNVPAELYPTSYVTQRTVAKLEALARSERPFYLFCSYPDPHHPFTPPAPYYDMYSPDDVPLPETFDDPHVGSAPHFRHLGERRGTAGEDEFVLWAPDADQYRHAAAAEYGMITMIDEGIGEIRRALERLGLAQRTVVVFTSDHGDMFGDHGLMLKGCSHYDALVRIPLVIRNPSGMAARSRALVGSIDLPATVLELAGQPRYHGLQGRSLVPLLEDARASARSDLLIEEDELVAPAGLPRPPRLRTLITDEGQRLTLYMGTGIGELYDHYDDPLELVNRFHDRGRGDLRLELSERLVAAMTWHEDTARIPVGLG